MKRFNLILMAGLSILALSCKKNNDETTATVKADYYQLKIGNYWIYEGYTLDSAGVATSSGKLDSAYIEKDTMIRGLTFVKFMQRPYGLNEQMPSYLRDSSGYLVNNLGIIIASDGNFRDTLSVDTSHPTMYLGYLKMTGKDSILIMAGETFQTITSSKKVIPLPPYAPTWPVRYTYTVYGKGVGQMKTHSFMFTGHLALESRLIRYRIIN
jgi:hypothetical protein